MFRFKIVTAVTHIKKTFRFSTLVIFSSWIFSTGEVYSQELSYLLENEITNLAAGNQQTVRGEKLGASELVTLFYRSTNYQRAWNDKLNVAMFLALLYRASDEGLNPKEYHFEVLNAYRDQPNLTDQERIFFDILLTDAFMLYGSHLLWGKTDPARLYSGEWQHIRREADLIYILQTALRDKSLASSIDGLMPHYSGYHRLKLALQLFRKIQLCEYWPIIPEGDPLDSGVVDNRIPAIRKRLTNTGLLLPYSTINDSTRYDSLLVKAVKKFQQQYGLVVDGVIGKNTLASLNFTPEDHIKIIVANMERFRWLPENLSEKFVCVNIPSFHLELHHNDSVIMSMRAIVGRPDRRTPVLQSDIHYLILNPTWTVPPTILREDVLPAVKRSIKYLERNNLRVFNRAGEEVDAVDLPWAKFTEKNFPYQIRQDPGPNNSLGLIKFQFPNNHKVFLHDTNHPNLFSLTNRALSSGCIRIEHPFALATYLLRETPWTEKQIGKKIESGKTTTVMFPQPVPIYLFYFTAFVDDQNVLQVRNDLYSWDDRLINSLSE